LSSSEAPDATPPGNDVRALFEKANIGKMRYLTFATQNTPERNEGNSTLPVAAEPTVMPAVNDINDGNSRRALNSVLEHNARLRIASFRPGLVARSGAALAFASYAGGVGKTTLCATVARVLSSRLGNVLVADRCPDGIIPYYFSLERQNAGGLQTVYPNKRRAGYPITVVVAPFDGQPNASSASWLEGLQAESSLTLLDFPTVNGRSTEDFAGQGSQLVIPLVPDVQSVASIARVEELCGKLEGEKSVHGRNLFVLNRFDEARSLHREIRTHLEKLLEDRLAPVAVRESEYVAEALSQGMTVLDYVPQAAVVKDFEQFTAWLESRLSTVGEVSTAKVEIA
jgi:cellulose synthase operon protein YhjQ